MLTVNLEVYFLTSAACAAMSVVTYFRSLATSKGRRIIASAHGVVAIAMTPILIFVEPMIQGQFGESTYGVTTIVLFFIVLASAVYSFKVGVRPWFLHIFYLVPMFQAFVVLVAMALPGAHS